MKIETFTVGADTGCVAVRCGPLEAKFSNGFGDGAFDVWVDMNEGSNSSKNMNFVEYFEVYPNTNNQEWPPTTLMDYDCGGEAIHEFEPGRYFVYNNPDMALVVIHYMAWPDRAKLLDDAMEREKTALLANDEIGFWAND